MDALFLEHAGTAYALIFFGTLSVVAVWESLAPRRVLQQPLGRRWLGNFALLLINGAVLRWLAPISGVALALTAKQQGWGLLNQTEWPIGIGIFVAVVLLDFNRFVQHVLLHKVPFLWRLHRLHHSDPDFDFTTQLRFHPFEALFSVGCFSLFVIALGLPAAGVFLHSLLAAMVGFLQHGNVRCWRPLESTVRWFIVTSDLHRVHHSADVIESNSNYGNLLPLWDRIFGTYVAQPSKGHEHMQLGLIEYQDEEPQKLRGLLLDPFSRR